MSPQFNFISIVLGTFIKNLILVFSAITLFSTASFAADNNEKTDNSFFYTGVTVQKQNDHVRTGLIGGYTKDLTKTWSISVEGKATFELGESNSDFSLNSKEFNLSLLVNKEWKAITFFAEAGLAIFSRSRRLKPDAPHYEYYKNELWANYSYNKTDEYVGLAVSYDLSEKIALRAHADYVFDYNGDVRPGLAFVYKF